MSSTTSTKARIAVIGGTGSLGGEISTVLLTEFRDSFPTVRVFTRDPTSSKAQELEQKGAEIVKLDVESLETALAGVDVVVNALPTVLPDDVSKKVNEGPIKSGAKVYFAAQNSDHRLVDFSGYEKPEWERKKTIAAEVRALAKDKTKVISLYTGIFLDFLLSPYLGFDLEKNVFTPYGPATQKFAATSKTDIARAVARLALLALDASATGSVPDEVRIAGSIATFEGVRDIVAQVKGVPKGEIQSQDLEQAKQRLRDQHGKGSILEYLRVAFGENFLDHSKNDNELVNAGQQLWKWKTVEDQIRGSG